MVVDCLYVSLLFTCTSSGASCLHNRGNNTSTPTTTLSPWSTCLYREEKTMNDIL